MRDQRSLSGHHSIQHRARLSDTQSQKLGFDERGRTQGCSQFSAFRLGEFRLALERIRGEIPQSPCLGISRELGRFLRNV